MPLKIEIVKHRGQAVSEPSFVLFDLDGGTVGRSADNQLVLPGDCVSRKHASISHENGRYYLTDQSANGTQVCNKGVLLQGQKTELCHGDRLKIGDYELVVSIISQTGRSNHETGAFAALPPRDGILSVFDSGPDTQRVAPSGEMPRPKEDPGSLQPILSIDDFFRDAPCEEEVVVIAEPPEPEVPAEPAGLARERGVETSACGHPVIEEPVPQESHPGVRQSQGPPCDVSRAERSSLSGPCVEDVQEELFKLFLKGARIDEQSCSFNKGAIPEVMKALGAVFRELVSGIWTVLRGRSELKAEIRLQMTMVRPMGNNPLKMSPRVEDALQQLLKRDHPCFLEPLEAVRDGFEDIMNHQLAMNAGIQAALTEALGRFDPKLFSEKHKEAFSLRKEAKLWNAYCEAYNSLREDAAEGFFGKAFVRAYEEQLERLRSRKKMI